MSPEGKSCAMVGLKDCLVLAVDKQRQAKVWNFSYKPEYNNRTIGAGRIYSATALDKVDWQLFERNRLKGLDSFGPQQLQEQGFDIDVQAVADSELVLIKGSWDMMNSMDAFFTSQSGVFAKTQSTNCHPLVIEFLKRYEAGEEIAH
jgi:hypothetical protein